MRVSNKSFDTANEIIGIRCKIRSGDDLESFWSIYRCLQRIREGSVIHQIQVINVGDMIESINGHRLIGCRHYEVAKMLKELPKGKMFTIKLVEPLKAFGRWKKRGRFMLVS